MRRAACVGLGLVLLAAGAEAAVASPRSFGGYACTLDCTAHAAGFRWAKVRGVLRARECIAAGRSFNEGCLTYVKFRGRVHGIDDSGQPVGPR